VRPLRRATVERANLVPGGHEQIQAGAMHSLAMGGQEYRRVPFQCSARAPENIFLRTFDVDFDHVRGFDLTCGKQGIRPRA
jgi:hypothetical protein